MLRLRPLLHASHSRRSQIKFRLRRRKENVIPLKQAARHQIDSVNELMKYKGHGDNSGSRFRNLREKLYFTEARLEREGVKVNKTFALQGLGDLEPLTGSANFGLSEKDGLLNPTLRQKAKYAKAPIPYTQLAARKLASAKFWPAAPPVTRVMSKEVQSLRTKENMSPSAQKFCRQLEFFIRRNIRACPAHIAERIDFSELIIQEVVGSNRSAIVYIVWSTVNPGARFEIEPLLTQLDHWVKRTVRLRIQTRPNIPRVVWIYDGGRLQRELPKKLTQEMTELFAEAQSTMKERVEYLKSMDKVENRMAGIPWYMPYLWKKEGLLRRNTAMKQDLEEVERRAKEAGNQKPSFVT
jgi:hypothetical protein